MQNESYQQSGDVFKTKKWKDFRASFKKPKQNPPAKKAITPNPPTALDIARGLAPFPQSPTSAINLGHPTNPALPKKPSKPMTLAERIIQEWKNDSALAGEFGSLGTYSAWREAEASGRVKIINKGSRPRKEKEITEAALPIQEKLKVEWDIDSDLREEFGGDFETYQSYRKANDAGQVKVLKK